MDIFEFGAGSEKRFFDFIGNLADEKIALISHTDLDGLISAKITNQVVKADFLRFVDYSDLNETLAAELKKMKMKKVI
ncbi:MAG: hypothetical protein AABY22_19120 [Nanoarchaeota archaeon]